MVFFEATWCFVKDYYRTFLGKNPRGAFQNTLEEFQITTLNGALLSSPVLHKAYLEKLTSEIPTYIHNQKEVPLCFTNLPKIGTLDALKTRVC